MPTWYAQTQTSRDTQKLREHSERLDRALAGDFDWLQTVLREKFTDTTQIEPHPYNIPRRVADMFARQYRLRPVQRRFVGAAGAPVDFAKLKEVYARSGIDKALTQVHRHLVIQQSQYVVVVPDSVRKVRLLRFSPWQVHVTPGNSLFADDLAHAAEVRLLVEVGRTADGGQELVRWGEIVLTPTEAWIEGEDPSDKRDGEPRVVKTSLYHPETNGDVEPDYSHPWADELRCPVWQIRSEDPIAGTSIPPIDEPLYAITVAFGIRVGDLAHVLHFQGHGQAVIEHDEPGSSSQKTEYSLGADKVLNIEGGTFKVVSPQGQTGEYNSFLEALLRWYALTAGIDQDQFMKAATARTAVSRRFDRLDRAEKRHDYAELFHEFEGKLARAVVRVLNMSAVQADALPTDVRVQVTFRDPPEPADPQSETQARTMGYEAGELSLADYIAERDNLPRDQALAKAARNRAERKVLAMLEQAEVDKLLQLAEVKGKVKSAVKGMRPAPPPPQLPDAPAEGDGEEPDE